MRCGVLIMGDGVVLIGAGTVFIVWEESMMFDGMLFKSSIEISSVSRSRNSVMSMGMSEGSSGRRCDGDKGAMQLILRDDFFVGDGNDSDLLMVIFENVLGLDWLFGVGNWKGEVCDGVDGGCTVVEDDNACNAVVDAGGMDGCSVTDEGHEGMDDINGWDGRMPDSTDFDRLVDDGTDGMADDGNGIADVGGWVDGNGIADIGGWDDGNGIADVRGWDDGNGIADVGGWDDGNGIADVGGWDDGGIADDGGWDGGGITDVGGWDGGGIADVGGWDGGGIADVGGWDGGGIADDGCIADIRNWDDGGITDVRGWDVGGIADVGCWDDGGIADVRSSFDVVDGGGIADDVADDGNIGIVWHDSPWPLHRIDSKLWQSLWIPVVAYNCQISSSLAKANVLLLSRS